MNFCEGSSVPGQKSILPCQNQLKLFTFSVFYTIISIMKRSNTYARINLENLKNNYDHICSLNKDKTPICIVKADAYGHGAEGCAKALKEAGAKWFAVASLDEAENLRKSGIEGNILILGYVDEERIDELLENDLTCGIYSLSFAKALNAKAAALGKTAYAHVKLNTGMNRLGFDCEAAGFEGKMKELMSLPNIAVSGVFSHYSTADEKDLSYSEKQRALFEKGVEVLKSLGASLELVHISNSAASLVFDCKLSNAFRPGIVLYGVSPVFDKTAQDKLRPVMSFYSRIANIFPLKAGGELGYGRKYKAPSDRKIATICAGYADGYFRALSGKACVYINGFRAKIVGNVCMDMLMADITDIPEAKVGDEVELFGEHISVCELAELAGTIPYEIMCAVSKRVKREYLKSEEKK